MAGAPQKARVWSGAVGGPSGRLVGLMVGAMVGRGPAGAP